MKVDVVVLALRNKEVKFHSLVFLCNFNSLGVYQLIILGFVYIVANAAFFSYCFLVGSFMKNNNKPACMFKTWLIIN